MKKSVNRPQRLALTELDGALDKALQRVEQARELSQTECLTASGGMGGTKVFTTPVTFGFNYPTPPLFPQSAEEF